MASQLIWTGEYGSTEQTYTLPRAPAIYDVGLITDAETVVTAGGKAYTVVHDAWWQGRVTWRGIRYEMLDYTGESQGRSMLSMFESHATRGGEFTFVLDSTQPRTDKTLSGAVAADATSITLNAAVGMANNDWILIQRADDPTVNARVMIYNQSGAVFSITEGVADAFADGDTVWHADAFPNCVLLNPSKPIIREREGGKGAYAFDLSFDFRTVR